MGSLRVITSCFVYPKFDLEFSCAVKISLKFSPLYRFGFNFVKWCRHKFERKTKYRSWHHWQSRQQKMLPTESFPLKRKLSKAREKQERNSFFNALQSRRKHTNQCSRTWESSSTGNPEAYGGTSLGSWADKVIQKLNDYHSWWFGLEVSLEFLPY